MSEFKHSIVLFSGEDGLPLEFNVRNTNNKTLLRAMIEYGGGLCSQSENAVHLVGPVTKVLNADLGKKLVSSQYIFDCVKQNYLLDVNDYVSTISEAQTSDIDSDEDHERLSRPEPNGQITELKIDSQNVIMESDIGDASASNLTNRMDCTGSKISIPAWQNDSQNSSTTLSPHSESFIEGSIDVNSKLTIASGLSDKNVCNLKPLTSTAKDCHSNVNYGFAEDPRVIHDSASLVSPIKTTNSSPVHSTYSKPSTNFIFHPENPSPTHTLVSSSQPTMPDLDQFDNILLNKAQQKCPSDEECLSQSYTVSSSADAQVASKPCSSETYSAEIFAGPAIPDSPMFGQTDDHYLFVKKLEAEVEKILLKPSPKSIAEKICLVKYICCVKRLPPAAVLQSLQRL